MATLVDGRWVQANGLIVCHVTEPLSISDQKLWIETPGNYRGRDDIIIAIHIRPLGYVEELPTSTTISSPRKLDPFQSRRG
jgi:hypothetical protein